jgi:hypothetical protein
MVGAVFVALSCGPDAGCHFVRVGGHAVYRVGVTFHGVVTGHAVLGGGSAGAVVDRDAVGVDLYPIFGSRFAQSA